MNSERKYYVYYHRNLTTNEIFYVGMGSARAFYRAYSIKNRNHFWNMYVKKHGGFNVEIFKSQLTRQEACDIEIAEINKYGKRHNKTGQLVNMFDGGEANMVNYTQTISHKEKIRLANIGRITSEETKKKQSLRKLGIKKSEEFCKKVSAAKKGCTFTEEHRENLSKAAKGIKKGPQTREAIEARRKGGAFLGRPRQIICLNNGQTYSSAKEASEILGLPRAKISSVCTGNRKHTGGYKFKHA